MTMTSRRPLWVGRWHYCSTSLEELPYHPRGIIVVASRVHKQPPSSKPPPARFTPNWKKTAANNKGGGVKDAMMKGLLRGGGGTLVGGGSETVELYSAKGSLSEQPARAGWGARTPQQQQQINKQTS
jgi:hypothetical protein